MAKQKSTPRKRESLTIMIRGTGISIDAKIADVPDFGAGLKAAIPILAEQLAEHPSPTPGPTQSPDHDFDIVQRVIKHAPLQVIQAIADLVRNELETRQAAS